MRGLLVLALPVLAVLLAAPGPLRARAQDAAPRELHFGAGSCAAQACHGGADPERAEYKTWATRDRHSRAFEVLGEPLGRRIGERLGLDPQQSPRCLDCHATTGVELADTFDQADGVSCELCHGGARAWLGPHAAPEWKQRGAGEKERLGLRDLSTARRRAAVCVTCHAGAPGREITHDIMAAGHPPLAFELAAFLDSMPRHWPERETARPLETWIEGLRAVALARLDRAVRAAAAGAPPDFTLYDCDACHHAAYSGSVYERRAPAGTPGEPPPDLAALRVLERLAGDPARAQGTDPARLRRDVAAAEYRAEPAAVRARLKAVVAGIESGDQPTPRSELRQLAWAARLLAAERESESFATAWKALDEALADRTPYDDAACARLVRRLLGPER